jgi:hypothetical protein
MPASKFCSDCKNFIPTGIKNGYGYCTKYMTYIKGSTEDRNCFRRREDGTT